MPAAAFGEAAHRRRRRSSSGSRASSSGRSSSQSSAADAAMLSPPPLSLGDAPLQPLDFDELEPLPPSRLDISGPSPGFTLGSRSHATLSSAEVSPQWSAAGSATGSPRSTRQTRVMPAAPPPLSLDTEMLASAQAASATASPESYSGGAPAHDAAQAPRAASARYLTVSAVLSRSGKAHVVRADEGAEDVLRLPSGSSKSRRVSNGGALEAVGALLLSRGDSLGAASNLSSQRHSAAGTRVRKEASRRPNLLARASRAWMQGLKEVRFGIAMPELSGASPGSTIAERRARRAQAEADGIAVVGGRRNQPSFEVPRPSKSTSPARTPLRRAQSAGVPSTLLPASSSVYGRGSAWGVQEAPEAPPSPIGMPGAWSGGATGWSSRSGEGHEDGALLLPPPLLDDHSSARSFEGESSCCGTAT
jgi:hypothetical protein